MSAGEMVVTWAVVLVGLSVVAFFIFMVLNALNAVADIRDELRSIRVAIEDDVYGEDDDDPPLPENPSPPPRPAPEEAE